LNARQAAAALAVSERTIFRLVKAGTIPALHLGAALRFDTRDLTALIDRLKAESASAVGAEADGAT
jgi:excisionase family DNA binding protein